jgi:hypothetical protein
MSLAQDSSTQMNGVVMEQAQSAAVKPTKEVKGFDINDISSTDSYPTHRVSVLDDEDGNTVSGFIIVGKNSNEYQAAAKQIRVNNIMRASKRKSNIDAATTAGAELIARTVDEGDRVQALAVVTGWYGFMSDGQLIRFDKTLVERMFNRYPTWQAKVLAALEDDSNFMKA